jgi:hypothetical protein
MGNTHTQESWVWVINLFTQSKTVNIVIILNIIDSIWYPHHNSGLPIPILEGMGITHTHHSWVWVCMGMGKGRVKNTQGLPMSNTKCLEVQSQDRRKTGTGPDQDQLLYYFDQFGRHASQGKWIWPKSVACPRSQRQWLVSKNYWSKRLKTIFFEPYGQLSIIRAEFYLVKKYFELKNLFWIQHKGNKFY